MMNKKAFVMEEFVRYLLPLIVLVIVIGFLYTYWGRSTGKDSTISQFLDAAKIDSDFLNLKPALEKEEEKCAKFTNINNCLGTNSQKTGCFWGKTTSRSGCYSCINKKYFGDNFGKCRAYSNIISKLEVSEARIICENNPCDFKKTDPTSEIFVKCSLSVGTIEEKISSIDCHTVQTVNK